MLKPKDVPLHDIDEPRAAIIRKEIEAEFDEAITEAKGD